MLQTRLGSSDRRSAARVVSDPESPAARVHAEHLRAAFPDPLPACRDRQRQQPLGSADVHHPACEQGGSRAGARELSRAPFDRHDPAVHRRQRRDEALGGGADLNVGDARAGDDASGIGLRVPGEAARPDRGPKRPSPWQGGAGKEPCSRSLHVGNARDAANIDRMPRCG